MCVLNWTVSFDLSGARSRAADHLAANTGCELRASHSLEGLLQARG